MSFKYLLCQNAGKMILYAVKIFKISCKCCTSYTRENGNEKGSFSSLFFSFLTLSKCLIPGEWPRYRCLSISETLTSMLALKTPRRQVLNSLFRLISSPLIFVMTNLHGNVSNVICDFLTSSSWSHGDHHELTAGVGRSGWRPLQLRIASDSFRGHTLRRGLDTFLVL